MKDHMKKAEDALEAAAEPGTYRSDVLVLQYALAQAEGTLAVAHELRLLRESMEGR
jgi:hypothetical protein